MGQLLEAFSFGYWGWGPRTAELVAAFDAVEAERGFEPPLLVDVRIRRTGRAPGFQGNAFGDLLGDRYVHLPGLGNASILTGAADIEIADPSQARALLDLIRENDARRRRVVFFCACEALAECHRKIVADLLLEEALRAEVSLQVAEWPGDEPVGLGIDVTSATLRKIRRGTKTTVPIGGGDTNPFGVPWYSVASLTDGNDMVYVLVGPGRYPGAWELPILAVGDDAEGADDLFDEARRFRDLDGVGSRIGRGSLGITHDFDTHC